MANVSQTIRTSAVYAVLVKVLEVICQALVGHLGGLEAHLRGLGDHLASSGGHIGSLAGHFEGLGSCLRPNWPAKAEQFDLYVDVAQKSTSKFWREACNCLQMLANAGKC